MYFRTASEVLKCKFSQDSIVGTGEKINDNNLTSAILDESLGANFD